MRSFEKNIPEAPNSENFTLQDFISTEGDTLLERVGHFSEYLGSIQARGEALYAREIVGPSGPRVDVRDTLTGKVTSMVMMGSNNYLGFANHPKVKEFVCASVEQNGVGMGGPPLLSGMSAIHRELEKKLAALKHQEDALIYPSGFQANTGWTGALLRTRDHLICDELHHASMFDGMRVARMSARFHPHIMKHNDLENLEYLLRKSKLSIQTDRANSGKSGQIFVAVEGVYSMDGDIAPLDKIAALCTQYGATLVVDDAHGTGVLGKNGGGTACHFGVSDQVALSMGTFSKSFGVTGGFIAGRKAVIDYLRYFSRSYMFSAHIPQVIAAAVIAGIDLLSNDTSIQNKLHQNVRYMVKGLNEIGYPVNTESAIIPIILSEDTDVRLLGRRLHEEGLFANLIEAPAVPKDSQRIRLSIMATHSTADLDFTLGVLKKLGQDFGLTT